MGLCHSQGMHSSELDHIVVGCRDLASGTSFFEQALGVGMSPGGQHLGWGTHNRLLRLGQDAYLELIALDPSQPSVQGDGLFAMNRASMQSHLGPRPRLIHAVHRVPPGTLQGGVPMQRGERRWSIKLEPWPADALRLAAPTLIDWGEHRSVAYGLPHAGVSLVSLAADLSEARLQGPAGLLVLS